MCHQAAAGAMAVSVLLSPARSVLWIGRSAGLGCLACQSPGLVILRSSLCNQQSQSSNMYAFWGCSGHPPCRFSAPSVSPFFKHHSTTWQIQFHTGSSCQGIDFLRVHVQMKALRVCRVRCSLRDHRNTRSVLSIVGCFGFGNAHDKNNATESRSFLHRHCKAAVDLRGATVH